MVDCIYYIKLYKTLTYMVDCIYYIKLYKTLTYMVDCIYYIKLYKTLTYMVDCIYYIKLYKTLTYMVDCIYYINLYYSVIYSATIESKNVPGLSESPSHMFFNGLLYILQLLHILWTYMILRIAYRKIVHGKVCLC